MSIIKKNKLKLVADNDYDPEMNLYFPILKKGKVCFIVIDHKGKAVFTFDTFDKAIIKGTSLTLITNNLHSVIEYRSFN